MSDGRMNGDDRDSSRDLNEDIERRLVDEARRAMDLSYSPYSHYPVGAALLGGDGRIMTAANIENAAYPVSLCAERAAVACALAQGVQDLIMIAVASGGDPPAPPCGACRQVLSEFNASMPVLVAGPSGPYRRFRLDELLPFSFGPAHLHGV